MIRIARVAQGHQKNLGKKMQFADSPGPVYFTQTSELPPKRLKTTVGLDLKSGDHLDARLEYTGEFANHFNSNTGALKVGYRF